MTVDAFAQIAGQIDELSRRLSVVESTSPGGLGEIQWTTAGPLWTMTPAGVDSWSDDAGGGTPATITVQDCPSSVLVYASGYINNVANLAGYETRRVRMGVAVSGTDPGGFTISDTAGTGMVAEMIHNDDGNKEQTLNLIAVRNDITAGSDATFTLRFSAFVQSVPDTNKPQWNRMSLLVVPLGPTGG